MPILVSVLGIVGGIVLMVFGSWLLVGGASNIARHLGVSDLIIGATIVALGTSLPELCAVVVSSFRGKAGIGLGNIVGSNVLNVLAILGVGVLILPIAIDRKEVNTTTLVAFVGASLYLLYCLLFRREINRYDGVILFTSFLLFSFFSYWRR